MGAIMARKQGFTMEQHNIVGAKLRQLQRDLADLRVGVSHHYTLTGDRSSRVLNGLAKMDKALSTVRSELEELMAKEHTKEWNVSVYYGGAEPDAQLVALARGETA